MHILTCSPADARSSEIRIGEGALDAACPSNHSGAFLLADAAILERHPHLAEGYAGTMTLTGGESVKTFATLEQVLRRIAQLDLDRGARLVALGGGTIGDLAGLAASLYKRGIELTMIPTTLLAMLDSSVGGKTAINLPEGKNLIGHVWPASQVLIDPLFLPSLTATEFGSGLGEALKMAIGLDAELFDLLESRPDAVLNREREPLQQVIVRAVRAKIAVVEQDVHESGPRRLLNLGHTLGHALEMQTNSTIPHGHAVARGLHFSLDVAQTRGWLEGAAAERCRALLRRYGFEAHPLPPTDALLPFLARDKKVEGEHLHFVVPTGIGRCRSVPLTLAEIATILG